MFLIAAAVQLKVTEVTLTISSVIVKLKNKWHFLHLWCFLETWSLTLREEHRLRVFENRVLRRVFGPKRDEVTGMEKIT